jgi:hypothetical protein
MINSLEVGGGQRVVWVAAHATRAALGLRIFYGHRRLCRGGFHHKEMGKENLSEWWGCIVGMRLYFVGYLFRRFESAGNRTLNRAAPCTRFKMMVAMAFLKLCSVICFVVSDFPLM